MGASTSRTVKVKFDGDAQGLRNASKEGEREVDRFTKSVDKKFRKSGDDSGKSFGSSLKKWFTGEGGGLFKEIGKSGGTVFGSGMLGALKTPILGPLLLATVGAVAATVMPAVGAIAGAGLVLGFGAGLAGLGITFAAKSDVVKKAWSKTLGDMGAQMTLLSKPFEGTLVSIAGFARRTFNAFAPDLKAGFAKMAPEITLFADQVTTGLEELAPAVQPMVDAFDAVLRTLGPATQGLLRQTSEGLQDLARSVKANPDGLADLVDGAGDLIKQLLDGIAVLNNINGQFERMTGGVSAVDVVMGLLKATVGVLFGPFSLLSKVLEKAGIKADDLTSSVAISTETAGLWTQGLDASQLAALGVGTAAGTAATGIDKQKQSTDDLITSMHKLNNLALELSGSQIGFQAAVDDATASVKENGRTLDINTAKGRANRTALNDVASAANAQTDAMLKAGSSNETAGAAAESARGRFVKIATQMGLSKSAAEKLAASLIAIPANTKANTSTNAPTTKKQVDALATSLAALKNRTVYVNMVQTGSIGGIPAGIKAPARASGGMTAPKRRYLYGERGPEIGEFGGTGTGGPKILSAEQTRMELSAPADPQVLEVHIEIGGEVVRVTRQEIKADKKATRRVVKAGAR